MEGWPVWLASVTLRDRAWKIRPTETWTAKDHEHATAVLDMALGDVGDDSKQRQFRMCSTLCRHRALTDAEASKLPSWWFTEIAKDIAGGPVELEWEKGLAPSLSTRPCEHPSWVQIDPNDARLKFPMDCGECEPCKARAMCANRPMRKPTTA